MKQVSQTQHTDGPHLHRDVRQQCPKIDYTIIPCIAWATNCYNLLWFEWANDAIWIWVAPSNYFAKLERFQPTTKSI